MFEDIGLFLVILLLGLVIPPILFSVKNRTFRSIIRVIGIIGVIIHELAHAIICIIVGEPVSKIHISKKGSGFVRLKYPERENFLQALLTGIAPLIVSSYIAWLLLVGFFTEGLNDFIQVLCIILFVSTIIGASPSWQDIRLIGRALKRDPSYSLYQIFLLALSVPIVYFLTLNLELPYYYSPFYYVLIGVCYYILKYSHLGMKKLIIRLRMNKFIRKQTDMYNTKKFYKKRHKPKKHPEELIERGQW